MNFTAQHNNFKVIRAVSVGLIIWLVAFGYFSRYCDNSLFTSDAADYVRSTDGGFFASYLDARSVGLWGAIAIFRHRPDVRSHLWDFLEREDDAAAARHFHVAPGFYGNVVARDWGADNRIHRLVMAAAGALAIGIMFTALYLTGAGLPLAFAASILAALSPSVVITSTEISPHAPFMPALLAAGFAFARYLETNGRVWAIASGVTLGIAVATCEMSMVILAAFALIIVSRMFHAGLESTLKWLGQPSLCFLGTLIFLWPAGVFRGSYVLSYGVFVFQALFRRGEYFGEVSPMVSIIRGAQGSLLVVIVLSIVAVATVALQLTAKSNHYIQVFSWLTLGFLVQGIFNRFQNPTYAAHFILLAWVLFALAAHEWISLTEGSGRRAILVAVLCTLALAAVAARSWPSASMYAEEQEQSVAGRAQRVIAFAVDNIPAGATVLTNHEQEIWRLYLPEIKIEQSTDAATLKPRPWTAMPQDFWVIADPSLLTLDWNKRLGEIPPTGSVGGLVLAHVLSADRMELLAGASPVSSRNSVIE